MTEYFPLAIKDCKCGKRSHSRSCFEDGFRKNQNHQQQLREQALTSKYLRTQTGRNASLPWLQTLQSNASSVCSILVYIGMYL